MLVAVQCIGAYVSLRIYGFSVSVNLSEKRVKSTHTCIIQHMCMERCAVCVVTWCWVLCFYLKKKKAFLKGRRYQTHIFVENIITPDDDTRSRRLGSYTVLL